LLLAGRFQAEGRAPTSLPSGLRFSQVKPLYRPGEGTLTAIESFLRQREVPPHDVYLCSAQPAPQEWLRRHPQVTWLRLQADQSQNGKAATLSMAERYWSGQIFVISDADMWAPEDALHGILRAFEDPEVGVVTCLYRSTAPRFGDWCHLLEALCILDFASSVLVARRTEGIRFAMGSTMAIRREVLERIGGFQALTPYLADDYQLGYRAWRAGYRVALAPTVLQTEPPRGRLGKALAHQYRWLVTSRVSRPAGHAAFVVTQGFLWAALLVLTRPAWGALAMLFWCAVRVLFGGLVHLRLGGRWREAWQCLFLPWKDALYLGLWVASLRGDTVLWGERRLLLDREGRIVAQTGDVDGAAAP
jgi:ceramide glucosyltransferase